MGEIRKEVMIVEIETQGMMQEVAEIYELAKQLKDKIYRFEGEAGKIKLKEASDIKTTDAID